VVGELSHKESNKMSTEKDKPLPSGVTGLDLLKLPFDSVSGMKYRVKDLDGVTRKRTAIRLPDGTILETRKHAGRPRKLESKPSIEDLQYHQRVSLEKDQFVEDNDLVNLIRQRSDTKELFQTIKVQVAKEAAALSFDMKEDSKRGRNTSAGSIQRINALLKLATLEAEIKKMGADTLDLKSEKFQKVFKMLIEKMQEVARETMPPEVMDLFFTRLQTAMEGWEEQAALAIVK